MLYFLFSCAIFIPVRPLRDLVFFFSQLSDQLLSGVCVPYPPPAAQPVIYILPGYLLCILADCLLALGRCGGGDGEGVGAWVVWRRRLGGGVRTPMFHSFENG